jgi:hypothetical protein
MTTGSTDGFNPTDQPDGARLDAAAHERLRARDLAALLAEAEADVAAGRTTSLDELLNEFGHSRKIS